MSFSSKVKEELFTASASARHCQLAEISSILQFCGKVYCERQSIKKERIFIKIHTENKLVAKKCFTLLKKAFNIYPSITVRQNKKQSRNVNYILTVENSKDVKNILQTLKWYEELDLHRNQRVQTFQTHSLLLKNHCCERSF